MSEAAEVPSIVDWQAKKEQSAMLSKERGECAAISRLQLLNRLYGFIETDAFSG